SARERGQGAEEVPGGQLGRATPNGEDLQQQLVRAGQRADDGGAYEPRGERGSIEDAHASLDQRVAPPWTRTRPPARSTGGGSRGPSSISCSRRSVAALATRPSCRIRLT